MTESRLRWLLVISFGLNLFLLGIMVARIATMAGHGRHHYEFAMRERMGPWEAGGGPFAEGAPGGSRERLSDADREIVRTALQPTRPTKADRQAMEDRVEQMRKLVAADVFDAEAFKGLQQQGATERARRQAERQQAVVDALSKLSPEGRKMLGEGPGLRLLMGGGRPMRGERMMFRSGMMHSPGAIPMDPGAAPLAAPPPGPN